MPPFDEMLLSESDVRQPYEKFFEWFAAQDTQDLASKAAEAESFFRRTGITFNVYGQEEAAERLIPFDLVPRIMAKAEWDRLALGIEHDGRTGRRYGFSHCARSGWRRSTPSSTTSITTRRS